uniref:Uncharacterized protein n=1 Tax=Arundo donax TaxID=35708 RepID=A0A0A8YD59_ARUDO
MQPSSNFPPTNHPKSQPRSYNPPKSA